MPVRAVVYAVWALSLAVSPYTPRAHRKVCDACQELVAQRRALVHGDIATIDDAPYNV